MKKSAFTLIELLVVIAIIAVLAGIALPVFGKVQERGKATSDASNLRQLGIGTVAYLTDHDDQIFSESATDPWPVTLQDKYVPNWKAFRSPFDKVTPARPDKATAPGVPVSYGINPNILTQTKSTDGFDGNTSKYISPSQLIYMAPAVDAAKSTVLFPTDNKSETNVKLAKPSGSGAKTAKDMRGTHANRSQINVLFADTHMESITYRDFSESSSEAGKQRWEPTYQPKTQ